MMMMNNPMACVLAPTRELAIQIYNASKMMTLMAGLRMCVVYGGADRYSQISNLNRGCDILIATPGRLIDFLKAGNVNLGMVNYFVLDEADRMLVRVKNYGEFSIVNLGFYCAEKECKSF
jgi:superfamily II DNA/RNA helicase